MCDSIMTSAMSENASCAQTTPMSAIGTVESLDSFKVIESKLMCTALPMLS